MSKQSLWIALVVAGLMPAVVAQQDSSLEGRVEVGYRSVDLGGNELQYRQDVNLPDNALRLFDLALEYDTGETKWVDRVWLDARGVGGEPYSRASFGMRKDGRWDLEMDYRSVAYFYRDLSYWYSPVGDLHNSDTDRKFFKLNFHYRFTEWFDLRVGADTNDRDGQSSTTRNLQREVFVLEQPVDHLTTNYWVAGDFEVGWANITVEQRFYNFENRTTIMTDSNDGIAPGGAFLARYDQHRTENVDAPITRLGFRGRPLRWLRFNLRYSRIEAESDYQLDASWAGLDFTDTAFQTTATNQGKVDRTSDLVDLDVVFGLSRKVDLIVDYGNRSWDQTGTIDFFEEQIGGIDQGLIVVQGNVANQLELQTMGLTVDWRATRKFQLALGAGRQDRSTLFQLSGPEVDTERDLYRARIDWRPNRLLKLNLDYDQGDTTDPLTPASPTSTSRLRFQADVHATKEVTVTLNWLDRAAENDLSYPLGIPTDDNPPATEISLAEFDTRSIGLVVSWHRQGLNLTGGYWTTQIDANAQLVYWGFDPLTSQLFRTRGTSDYSADQDVFNVNLVYSFLERWQVGFRGTLYKNEGQFPNPQTIPPAQSDLDLNPSTDSTNYMTYVLYDFPGGIFARLRFERYDYQENTPFAIDAVAPALSINDYDADLWTVSVGYRF
jgi:hypothetical protein